jgi:hypothetical protein
MKATFGFLAAVTTIGLMSCLQNPNSAPEISSEQIRNIQAELRLATQTAFLQNPLDTLPKHIAVNDTAHKNLFKTEQIDAWLILSRIPKGVQATITVDKIETRVGRTTVTPNSAVTKLNTCCSDKWTGNHSMQASTGIIIDRPESLPYKLVIEAKINDITLLKDSITIL